MKKNRAYMVVETHSAYAVVLDNSGRFIKTANPGYKVGDTIDKVIPLLYPQDKKRRKNTVIRLAASLAACICLCAFGIYEYQYMYTEYGTVHMQINPEIEISLSRSGRVLDVSGENADGEALLENFSYSGKDKETLVDELADLAIEQNYLAEGGQIAVSVDARSDIWADRVEQEILDELNRYLQEQGITVEITAGSLPPENPETTKEILDQSQTVTIPIPQAEEESEPEDSGYDDSSDDGITDYSIPSAPAEPSAPAQNDSQYDTSGDSPYSSGENTSSGNNNNNSYDNEADTPYDDNDNDDDADTPHDDDDDDNDDDDADTPYDDDDDDDD